MSAFSEAPEAFGSRLTEEDRDDGRGVDDAAVMAISLKNAEVDRLTRAVASLTGESLTEAVQLAERLERENRSPHPGFIVADDRYLHQLDEAVEFATKPYAG